MTPLDYYNCSSVKVTAQQRAITANWWIIGRAQEIKEGAEVQIWQKSFGQEDDIGTGPTHQEDNKRKDREQASSAETPPTKAPPMKTTETPPRSMEISKTPPIKPLTIKTLPTNVPGSPVTGSPSPLRGSPLLHSPYASREGIAHLPQ